MMRKINVYQLGDIVYSLNQLHGYLTDNSCSDPDCCGGPFYDEQDYTDGIAMLKELGLEYDPTKDD